ncbi:MAG: hypothetical protein A3I07_00745 [Candidatus Doudnabacteria bacterium RIFCSPLOWO2_02_FULL_42_9]|uniref:Uncharacterized protein n=1 Tax=Candidatus Doudnabacteria bacterium RIFCSPHIGHO2_01_FULL_41_86 TaxID=1817821 RepID=A0A1F5NAF1_9BACT|nr:MAG: hypothetical protein A2717_02755 [Candidatus Doudnabacteria bacterium RIFCSPHIGHO2_01_FULL_41_86]OGE75512.1 MAG: hypothetical protein A3K07_01085 [Candidatus Doudnabacteria bacterium RIFCSPHIGHO2_01_43_10]OGE85469.1 MAG: hypothetical protein A3E28_02325 [Candidatus Doudnabacteria bacterium RIFCSPHIGHO2_12_FULL_42_22]OGE87007.1 MAG: hypothetical protein A3C49_03160 [Candidatus Doudnabacteria bacterium RIFCSPHIGHO2_02_FULL_42_25]OGE92606.1 MAG: hypothetical protein A2895_03315 [Candidatus
MEQEITNVESKPKKSWLRWVLYGILVLVLMFIAVQFFNAAKYEALVQVIEEDKIGVNPTGERLDFGDLPRDKSAVRTVTLESKGNTATYVMVWKFGAISDFMKVNKNYFTLEPGQTERLEFNVHIPNSAEYKYYKGKVWVFQIPKIW